MRKIIELDIDGVIGDLYTPIEKIINKEFPSIPFSFKKDVKDFGMSGINDDIKHRIFELFKDPNVIMNEPLYRGAEKFLINLSSFAKQYDYNLVIHTHMMSKEVAKTRKIWIDNIIKKLKINNVKIVIDCGDQKTMLNNQCIVIEDCVENLYNSKAKIKILQDRSHNNEKANQNLLSKFMYKRCKNYNEILFALKESVV